MTPEEKRAELKRTIASAELEAYKLQIQREYVAAQGLDDEGREQAAKAARELDMKRENVLKGLERLREMLAELPEDGE